MRQIHVPMEKNMTTCTSLFLRHFSLLRTKRIRVFAPQLGKAQTQILYDIKYKGIKYARTFRNINNQSV